MSDTRSFVDARHALYVGWVVGIAVHSGVEVTPITDDAGNYTDRVAVTITRSAGPDTIITMVVPPPPEDWLK